MTPAELVAQLCLRSYEPPLSDLRENDGYRNLANPVVVLLLLFDFSTEVTMSGITGFLINSTGRYADQTVEALEAVGCSKQSQKLREILDIAAGDGSDEAEDRIEAIIDEMDFGAVSEAMEAFAMEHRESVEAASSAN